MELTTSCRDADGLPRVAGAGGFSRHGGHDVQLMHNGVLVKRGGYYGDWTAEIIERLEGVHEPQEEKAVAAVLERLAQQPRSSDPPVCVELGSYWAYYSLWFLNDFPAGTAVCLEPDPNFMQVGVTNFALNNRSGTFIAGAVGTPADSLVDFVSVSDGLSRPTKLYTLSSLMLEAGLERVDILFVDIQGAEISLLESAQDLLRTGAIRFLVISTHDIGTTGSAMTHRHAEALLVAAGAHIVCEHSVTESFSADGLIVASFDERDADVTVEFSRTRAIESGDGEWEPRYDALMGQLANVEALYTEAQNRASQAELECRQLREQLATSSADAAAMRQSRSWRATAPLRRVRALLRRR